MAICPHTCPTGSSTLLSRQSIPQRFRSNNTGYRQQLHSRPTAQSLDSFGRKRASISHRGLIAQAQRPCISCAAATAEAPESTVKLESVPRGETDGANLVLENVTIQAGHRDLLQDVSWRLMPGKRVGLVGANGCGKSTLLKCLSGHRLVDKGTLTVDKQVELGYLEQTAVSGSERTVWEEVRSRMTQLIEAEAAIAAASDSLQTAGKKSHAAALQRAMDQFEAAGGYDADKRIAIVLTGLGFKQEQWNKTCNEFSGGWQMRIALARLLLGPAGQAASSGGQGGLLLLDEPTNHLDHAACKWLGSFLRNSSGGVIIVSHDKDLLQDACDQIVEVRGRQLHLYAGDYNLFLEQRELRSQQAASMALTQGKKIAQLEDFVARFGAGTKASQAQSRAKQLEKMKSSISVAPAPASGAGPGDAKKVRLYLPKAPACDQLVLRMEKASVGWGAPGQGKEPLLQGVDFMVSRGHRILVLGANGAGKTTLLKVLAGSVKTWAGKRKLGENVKISVFSQDLAQDLPMDQRALDYVLEKAREDDIFTTEEQGRKSLGALGLTGEMVKARIGDLSGGEKARVALAAFALVPCNLLLLDEASNHLDAATINALTLALQVFEGAIVAITHNKAFAESLLATHVLRVEGGTTDIAPLFTSLEDSDFTYDDTKEEEQKEKQAKQSSAKQDKEEPSATSQTAAKSPPVQTASPAPVKKKTKLKLGYREKDELKRLPAEIDALTAKKAKIEQMLESSHHQTDTNHQKVDEAWILLAKVVDEIDVKTERWLELEDLAEQ